MLLRYNFGSNPAGSFSVMLRLGFGQPIKVNWAYVTVQREDTSGIGLNTLFGIIYIPIFFSTFLISSWHYYFLPFQVIITYLLVILALRLLMICCMYASLSILIVREYMFHLSIHTYIYRFKKFSFFDIYFLSCFAEDTKEQSDSDAPKNNPQYTTVYVGNLGPEVRPLNTKIYLYETSHEQLRAESCNKLKVKSYYYETLLL